MEVLILIILSKSWFLSFFCEKDEARQEIKSHTHYLAVVSLEKTSSDDLVDCLDKALE